MGCSTWLDPLCISDNLPSVGGVVNGVLNPVGSLQGAALSVVDFFFKGFTDSIAKAAADLLTSIATSWLLLDDPNLTAADGPVAQLRAHTLFLSSAIAVGALMIAGIRLVLQRDGQEAGVVSRGIVALVLLTFGGVPAVMALLKIGDLYSSWIVQQSADNDFKGKMADLINKVAHKEGPVDATALTLIVLLILLFASLLQMVLFLARSVGLVLLTGLLPLAGAFGLTSGGQNVRRRYVTWLITFVLYKPVAATIYAASIWMMSKGTDFTTTFSGVVGICMAVAALPALMRLIAPAVSVGTAGWSDQGGMGRAASALSVANGAAALVTRRSAGSGGGGGGGNRPGGGRPATPAGATPGGGPPPPAPAGGNGKSGGGGGGVRNPLFTQWQADNGFQPSAGGPGRTGSFAPIGGGSPPSPGMVAAGQRQATAGGGGGVATGAARSGAGGGSAAAGPAVAAAVLVAMAPATVVRKIGRTAASGIDEVDY